MLGLCAALVTIAVAGTGPAAATVAGTFLPEPSDDVAAAVAIRAGKVYVAGTSRCLATSGYCEHAALERFGRDGHLDPEFGIEGRVGGAASGLSAARAIAVQPDGAIVVGGVVAATGVPGEGRGGKFAVARFLPDGSLDPSFGEGGIARTDFCVEPTAGAANAVLVQPDGRILAAGFVSCNGNRAMVIARYLSDGKPDPAFREGWLALDAGRAAREEVRAIALRPNGRIVIAGGANGDFTLFGLTRSGHDDTSFGHGGQVESAFTVQPDRGRRRDLKAVANAIWIDERGRIVVAGGRDGGENVGIVVRYLPSGDFDPSFGEAGTVTLAGFEPMGLAKGPCGSLALSGIESPRPRVDRFAFATVAADGGLAAKRAWLRDVPGLGNGSKGLAIATRGRLAYAAGGAKTLSGYRRFAVVTDLLPNVGC